MNPGIVSAALDPVLLGYLVLKERLRRMQWIAWRWRRRAFGLIRTALLVYRAVGWWFSRQPEPAVSR